MMFSHDPCSSSEMHTLPAIKGVDQTVQIKQSTGNLGRGIFPATMSLLLQLGIESLENGNKLVLQKKQSSKGLVIISTDFWVEANRKQHEAKTKEKNKSCYTV